MAKIIAVCRSKEKGTKKEAMAKGTLKEDYGLIGDAHADCCTLRQVSLLAIESINKIRSLGFDVSPGNFAENLTTEGIDLVSLPVSTRIIIGKEVILEITQIGKECHTGCAIRRQIGKCIMPKEGVFAKVIRGGFVRAGDTIKVIAQGGKDEGGDTKRLTILRVTEQGRTESEDTVVTEFPLTIILNNQEAVTLLCSPTKLEYLAIGYLWSEGLINSKNEIEEIRFDWETGVARVETKRGEKSTYRGTDLDSLSGGTHEVILTECRAKCVISHHIGKCIMPQEGVYAAANLPFKPLIASGGRRGSAFFSSEEVKTEPQIKISVPQVFSLMEGFIERSKVFKATGGVHGAALCEADNLLIFSEDIGRHNAIDKIFGECILKDITTDNRIIITSGRISSEILLKVARGNIALLISKSATTDLAVKLANDLGVTLISFVRGKRMNVYTHEWRIKTDGK